MDVVAAALISKLSMTPEILAELRYLNDGSDGDYNPSASGAFPYDINRFNNFTIGASYTINPATNCMYAVILVKGTCTINGVISASGYGASGGTYSNGSSYAGFPGMNGRGFAGSGGGGGGNIGYPGGNGGSTNVPGGRGCVNANASAFAGSPILRAPISGSLYELISFGGGGGSGSNNSGASSNTPGLGGAGGGGIIIFAPQGITGTGAIHADGLNAAAPSPTNSSNVGGGGGGGGGSIILISPSISALTLSANGGSGSSQGSGGGNTNGAAGGFGSVSKYLTA